MVVFPVSRRVADPLFNRSFGASLDALLDRRIRAFDSAASKVEQPQVPQMDVSESDSAYSIVLNVPGVTREQLKVSVQGRRVVIEANASGAATKPVDAAIDSATPVAAPTEPVAVAVERQLYSERTVARYARTVALPSEVDQSSSQARLENGVLTLTLAKKVPTGATQLSIN